MIPYLDIILNTIIPYLTSISTAMSLRENSAIAIGRIALICPEKLSPNLGTFGKQWCETVARLNDNQEKEIAFQGFCKIVSQNPEALVPHLAEFCGAVVKWRRMSPMLNETFKQILAMYKTAMGDAWMQAKQHFPPHVQQRLLDRYLV
jgi:transportin-1